VADLTIQSKLIFGTFTGVDRLVQRADRACLLEHVQLSRYIAVLALTPYGIMINARVNATHQCIAAAEIARRVIAIERG
jgi:hypothetical protein